MLSVVKPASLHFYHELTIVKYCFQFLICLHRLIRAATPPHSLQDVVNVYSRAVVVVDFLGTIVVGQLSGYYGYHDYYAFTDFTTL